MSTARERDHGGFRRAITGPVGRLALTVAVVVAVFAGVLPRIADYGQAWRLVRALSSAETLVIAGVAALNLISYAPLWMAALPGLALWRALMVDQASTAISNTVPIGFAFGVGTTATMLHSFGFPAGAITRGIALTGIWNNLVKLAMPALALAGLVMVGDAPTGLAVAAVLGSAVLVVVVGILAATVTHRSAGARVATAAERLAARAARARGRDVPTGWVTRTERFRVDSLELLRHRWVGLTVAAVASHVALFLVLLTCLRAVDGDGSDVHWVVVLAVFAVTRLVTLVPITPGALGVAELSYVAGLTAVGVGAGAAAAAVFLFRFLTWFLPIPLGLAAWVLWRRGVGRVVSAAESAGAAA